MSSQSSSGSAACNGPPARCAWIYTATDGFQAQIGKTSQGFKRLPPVKLFKLVNSENFYKVPTAPPHLFYHAQLLHYGLTPAQDVPAAVAILKAAFVRAGKPKKLKPPTSVYNVKQALKVEYWERIKLVKTGRTAEIRVELKELERKQAALKKEMRSLENHTESPERKQRHISISSSPPSQRGSANATVSAVEETKPIVRKRKALDNTIEESIKDGQITKKVRSSEKRDVAILPLPSQVSHSASLHEKTSDILIHPAPAEDQHSALIYQATSHKAFSNTAFVDQRQIGSAFVRQMESPQEELNHRFDQLDRYWEALRETGRFTRSRTSIRCEYHSLRWTYRDVRLPRCFSCRSACPQYFNGWRHLASILHLAKRPL